MLEGCDSIFKPVLDLTSQDIQLINLPDEKMDEFINSIHH